MILPVAISSRAHRASRQAKLAWRALGLLLSVSLPLAVLLAIAPTVARAQSARDSTVSVENRAYLTFVDENGAPGADTARSVILVLRRVELAALAVSKTLVGTDSIGVGDIATYQLTATNTSSTVAAQDVVLADSLPIGLVFVSADWTPEIVGRVVRFHVGALAPGQTITVTLVEANPTFTACPEPRRTSRPAWSPAN